MSSERFMAFSPSPSVPHSPHIGGLRPASSNLVEQEYLSELLAERKKLGPFMPVLPQCYRLLTQEILHTALLENSSILDQTGLEHGRSLASGGIYSSRGADMNGWASPFQSEMSGLLRQSSPQSWHGFHGNSSGLIVKRTIRVDIPVDKYPNYNFVGRLLGPRGNSLKRVEASTECRVLIRGRGSIKDPTKKERARDGLRERDGDVDMNQLLTQVQSPSLHFLRNLTVFTLLQNKGDDIMIMKPP